MFVALALAVILRTCALPGLDQEHRIVVSYPGEPDRFFERILGWPVGDGTCWVSIGGDSAFILEDLGNVAGLLDVMGQCDYPRSVVFLEQIMNAPSNEDVRSLVESARDEALMERCRWNLVVDREPSFFISWTGEQLDLVARGLLSRVMGVTSRSRTAFPNRGGFTRACGCFAREFPIYTTFRSRFIDELFRDMLGRAVFVTENDVFPGDIGVHSQADGSRVRISQIADDEIVSWRERRIHANEAFSAVELAALHHKLAVDPLRWLADTAMEKHWHSFLRCRIPEQLQGLIQIWNTAGTYGQLNLGGVAAMEEPARQIQCYFDANCDSDNVSWADSRFATGSRRVGDALVPSLGRHVSRQIKDFFQTADVSGGMLGEGGEGQSPGSGDGWYWTW